MTNVAGRFQLPKYSQLMYPVLQAVALSGSSARAPEITAAVIEAIGATDEQVAISYPNRPKSVLVDRIEWARFSCKQCGALDSPQRGLFVLSELGKEILNLPEAEAVSRLRDLDRQVRAARSQKALPEADDASSPLEDSINGDGWTDVLLTRLHRLTPEGFEELVLYVLRAFDLELTRVGGVGDEGIDGIGIAPLSPVLSSRVAVQAKRHQPTSTIGRETVALFQRDAAAAGAERAILVTLGRFSEPARKAATTATPTVDLIDGDRLCELVRLKEIGIRIVPQVQEDWFNRFDK